MKNFINKILFIGVLIITWQLVYMSQIFHTLIFPAVLDIFKVELILKGIIIVSIIGIIMSSITVIF